MIETPSEALRELARSYGVQLEYVGMSGKVEPASSRSLLAVLQALGASVESQEAAPAALARRRDALSSRRVEPVVVAWDGRLDAVPIRLPEPLVGSAVRCRLAFEDGPAREWQTSTRISRSEATLDRIVPAEVALTTEALATGYHRLVLEFADGQSVESLVISAPTRAYPGPDPATGRTWGVFCPLYSLHRPTSWGGGDFSDLEALIDWTAERGGGLVASLPMLASTFDGPAPIISPYSPTSKIFWNEFYIDLHRIPELTGSEAARAWLASDEATREIGELRASGLVDYGRQMRLKRRVLEILAEEMDRLDGERGRAFRDFVGRNLDVEAYAFFQAAGETFGRDWRSWPESVSRADVDPRSYRYHLYAQWQADEQLAALSSRARDRGLSWYLDFPIGVDFNSFDVWTYRHLFATGASVGCPPDPVFTKGQNWGFPPLHPDRHRESGYAYLIASLRAQLRYANALRIDHVMGLHRLFWIPQGAEAKDGAFVSTRADEIYAVLSVESHRHRAWLVGEDLGTVPPEVDGAMKQHEVRGMYVVQYEARPDPAQPLREVPTTTIASLNTHDMPPFAAWWGGLDLDDRKDLGLMSAETLEQERAARQELRAALVSFLQQGGWLDDPRAEVRSVVYALWSWLAASSSGVLLLNVEDLWLETNSQNTPNTYDERPNWRRKLRKSFEEFAADPDVLAILQVIDLNRRQTS